MSNLDDKLKKIVVVTHDGYKIHPDISDQAIAQIKQAFAEELKIDDMIQDMENLRSTMQQDMIRLGLTGKAPGLMTGQEWYDRFVSEFTSIDHAPATTHETLEAARRAAGLES